MSFGLRRLGMMVSGFAAMFLAAGVGCGVTRSGPGAAGPEANGPDSAQNFQADVVPVRALAVSDAFLWIGSDRGLRRAHLPAVAAEWVGPAAGIVGRRVSALAVDRQGRVLVATEAAVGRLADVDGRPRFAPVATLPAATHLVSVTAEGAGDGVWAGTAKGLFFLDGGNVSPIGATGGVEVTSLDLDADGKSVWAGLRGKGLVHVEAKAVVATFGPEAADPLDLIDVLGTAVLSNGTRIAVGRGKDGGTRLALLRMDGPELLVTQPDVPVVALISGPRRPLLAAGPANAPKLYSLVLVERGEVVEGGGFRFTPARKSLRGVRVAALPDPRQLPPEITIAVAHAAGVDGGGGGAGLDAVPGAAFGGIFFGTRAAGVARLSGTASAAPDYLPVGELAMEARGLSVACLEPERCVFSTGAGPGWIWDGRDRSVKPIPDGAIGGGLMALAGDGAATVYFVSGAGEKTLAIARLSSDGARWEPLLRLPVAVEGSPIATFATLSPDGNLWLALRDHAASGQEFGRGVIEVQLPSGRAIHHRPYREKEERPPEAIPVVGDVAAIRFAKGSGSDPDAIWFCTSVGVMRFLGGDLSRWGENEGLDSEHCHDLAIAVDGTVWVATEEGPARFDGRRWLRLPGGTRGERAETSTGKASTAEPTSRWPVDREGESVAARALAGLGQGLWAGTARGVWPLRGAGRPIDRAAGLIDDDVVDLVVDRFGRLWVLGHIGLTVRSMPR